MNLRARIRFLFSVAFIIAGLLLINAWLMYQNSLRIELNKNLQAEAEKVKVATLDVIRDLHLLDLGLRGYALTKNRAMLSTFDSAVLDRDRIFEELETTLRKQQYPHMAQFLALKDSVNNYFKLVTHLYELMERGDNDTFLQILGEDRGYPLWLLYKEFSYTVHAFENNVAEQAKTNYEAALKRSFVLQIIIFMLAAPALAYMAFFAARTFRVSDELRSAQAERNRMLSQQNEVLDQLVKEKTEDILTQNEEIVAQNEEIRAHNDQLVLQQQEIQRAQQIIEEQSRVIQRKNKELALEVERQTQDLRQTNSELADQNNRLQQFTYIISHNLRGPLARMQGLANILQHSQDAVERDRIFSLMVQSSNELDTIISDLSTILNIQKSNTQIRSEVSLHHIVSKVVALLEPEINQVQARVDVDIEEPGILQSLPPYLESVFYNLVSNAIKYRNPERPLRIRISSTREGPYTRLEVADNGLGIDLGRHQQQIFNLYKRFHSHVEGKGLGLYLVKTQVEALGGKISVESRVNEGTTFLILFR